VLCLAYVLLNFSPIEDYIRPTPRCRNAESGSADAAAASSLYAKRVRLKYMIPLKPFKVLCLQHSPPPRTASKLGRPHPPPRANRVGGHPPPGELLHPRSPPCSPTSLALTHRCPLDQSTHRARVQSLPASNFYQLPDKHRNALVLSSNLNIFNFWNNFRPHLTLRHVVEKRLLDRSGYWCQYFLLCGNQGPAGQEKCDHSRCSPTLSTRL
jgi:hypothetical protein